ncbi:hypothetical protein RchiOBHm_Chr4g0431431 [Rosa chinensis]|uniref:Secreted protein n=1 Tax=Rosa chinensis TaxID=74649 RepID=A0A2P6R0S5_ROSCH|nr:hypothetical protein RchiOBHm_Chr4g0431431 [Rosa chinensis]
MKPSCFLFFSLVLLKVGGRELGCFLSVVYLSFAIQKLHSMTNQNGGGLTASRTILIRAEIQKKASPAGISSHKEVFFCIYLIQLAYVEEAGDLYRGEMEESEMYRV